MTYKPQFFTTRRPMYDKPNVMGYAIWVMLHDDTAINICNIEKEPTTEMKKIIESAFCRGFAACDQIRTENYWCVPEDRWEER